MGDQQRHLGLTLPLTFSDEHPAQPRRSWFNITVRERSWRSSNGYALRCLDDK